MNIMMMTNTYAPHTGGVARSVQWFSEELRRVGNRVLVVAPSFDAMPQTEQDVVRVPAIQNFNGSDFSVRLPIPGLLRSHVDEFRPDLVHAHHPFLLGETALRVSALRNLPIVFTHHTMYEQYTHYVPGDSPAMQRFAVCLATEFANLCDHVVAPSESIVNVLRERGVTSDMTAIPTGINTAHFARGDGAVVRRKYDIPSDAFVVGHVGRLAPEKNLPFLARSVCRFLNSHSNARFLLVGDGPSLGEIRQIFAARNVEKQLHHPDGLLDGQDLVDAYHAMDLFAFASHSETQGMVLAEAMAAGVPVVAIDAPGAREVVHDTINGRLLPADNEDALAGALSWYAEGTGDRQGELIEAARRTAETLSMTLCATRLLDVYEYITTHKTKRFPRDDSDWAAALRLLSEQWNILTGLATAVGDALFGSESDEGLVQ